MIQNSWKRAVINMGCVLFSHPSLVVLVISFPPPPHVEMCIVSCSGQELLFGGNQMVTGALTLGDTPANYTSCVSKEPPV